MMTRGKRSSNSTASSTKVKRPRASNTYRPTKSKRHKQTSRVHSVPAVSAHEVPHPSELSREPVISGPSSVHSVLSPAAPSSVVSQDMVCSTTSAISSAVLDSLKSAGIIPQEPAQTSDPAAAVQGSVAQVVQDLTGEGHTLTSTSITSGPETDHRPDKIHTLISVPLSSRVPDKIQSKIWANEYIDLGTLLSSLPGDPKYNFTVKSSGSNQPVVSLEPVQNSKRITSIDQWTTAFGSLENEDRSTKHPNLENEAPKTPKRSTQYSKTKHPYLRQGSLRVATPSPRQKENHINSLKYFSVFLLNCKIRHASTT